ncbi:M15 family metallopeptidase [Paenibacillus rigui]|uniref:Peptidase M15 n=1 Tax=Paenibacillus rigui TaxID=554312 RepID=A0A229UIR9_9BACL|nr:M15 family metallopeptidase [Paenibacillus rigui]OXM83306.1 peptidase M15 [Paenibacillus rigui]
MMQWKTTVTAFTLASSLLLFSACEDSKAKPQAEPAASAPPTQSTAAAGTAGNAAGSGAASQGAGSSAASGTPSQAPAQAPASANGSAASGDKGKAATGTAGGGAEQVVTNPESISVLVNKQFALPSSYEPKDLVYPNVPFTFKEQLEKRKMRKEAAQALEKLFDGAKKDGVSLAGVSAYRSYATQKTVYNNYVKKDGEEKARTYSAVPGHSEHETGLAIDVSGSDGKCAAEDCFGNTKEASWLAKHAAEYGFIIRYLKGKESITGYQYEPWHIRYVGTQAAKEIADKGITLEEYMNAVPVVK